MGMSDQQLKDLAGKLKQAVNDELAGNGMKLFGQDQERKVYGTLKGNLDLMDEMVGEPMPEALALVAVDRMRFMGWKLDRRFYERLVERFMGVIAGGEE